MMSGISLMRLFDVCDWEEANDVSSYMAFLSTCLLCGSPNLSSSVEWTSSTMNLKVPQVPNIPTTVALTCSVRRIER